MQFFNCVFAVSQTFCSNLKKRKGGKKNKQLISISLPPDLWPEAFLTLTLELTSPSSLLAVCSISPRSTLLDSSDSAGPAQTRSMDPKAAREDLVSPKHQETVERAARKHLSFVLENEKQQWMQTVRHGEGGRKTYESKELSVFHHLKW